VRFSLRFLHYLFATAPFALILAAYAYGVALAHRYGQEALAGPAVGEILRVTATPGAAGQRGDVPGLVAEATRLAGQGLSARDTGATCRFETSALQRGGGGNLLVVAREPGGQVLHLRWAGGPTDATADCGSASDLRMRRDAFLSLQTFATFGTPELPQPIVP